MRLVWKILAGLAGLVALAGLGLYIAFWAAPIGIDNYVNKVSLELAMASPESFTQIGLLDNTPLDFHSGKLDDYTAAKERSEKALLRRARAGLDHYGPRGLSGQQLLTWRILAATLDDEIRTADNHIPRDPYRVNQVSGVGIDEPTFLTDVHAVKSRTSAERYIRRLVDFGRVLREVKVRIEEDRQAGITPPDFIIDRTLTNLQGFIADGATKNTLVVAFAPKLDQVPGLSAADKAQLLAAASKAVDSQVIPGYRALIGLFAEMRPSASHEAGVWRLPGGDAYYAERLKSQTTTDMTPDQVYELGLAEVARIEAKMTAILDQRGAPPGEIGDRLDRLMAEPAQNFPNTDAGRAEILAYLGRIQTGFEAKAKDWFIWVPTKKLEIVRVPDYAQDTSAGAYYMQPALDGSRPGRFYINLKNTANFPKWTLPTTFYHEGEPGHHFQLSAAQQVTGVPIIRRVLTPNAYAEGWGLYAETLAVEMGLYADDPLGELGKLQSEMFRAARLVVDTGIHAKHWSREQAIDYMRAKTGMTKDEVMREVERYVVWPGQACSYKIGELTILRLREKARAAMGKSFDIRQFHEQVLMNGGMPLDVLEGVIDQWIQQSGAPGAGPRAALSSAASSPVISSPVIGRGAAEIYPSGDSHWRERIAD